MGGQSTCSPVRWVRQVRDKEVMNRMDSIRRDGTVAARRSLWEKTPVR